MRGGDDFWIFFWLRGERHFFEGRGGGFRGRKTNSDNLGEGKYIFLYSIGKTFEYRMFFTHFMQFTVYIRGILKQKYSKYN